MCNMNFKCNTFNFKKNFRNLKNVQLSSFCPSHLLFWLLLNKCPTKMLSYCIE